MHLSRILSLASLALAATASAHEFWLQPANFRPQAGEVVAFHLFVGDGFPGEGVARNPARIEKFVVAGADGAELPVVGRAGADPAGMMRFPDAGTYVAVYDSLPAFVSLEAEKFEAYLKEKGLAGAARMRETQGKTKEPGRELYSRCAKTIVTVGNGSTKGFDRDFGMRLEIVLEAHPSALAAGAELPARVVFEGKPLAEAMVIAMRQGATESVTVKTDASGRFTMKLPAEGMWLLNCVHMVTAHETNSSGETADWESLWSSLTFEVPAKSSATAPK